MAASRSGETKDTLGTIFDFIFAETQKQPEKRKPIKYSHVDSSSEMVETLATVLEKPGLYVSDQIIKDIDDALNIQLLEAYFGKNAPQGKTKIGTRDIINILKNPNDFFDKAYQKSNPKMNAAEWAGKTYRGLNASSWAKKHGIKDRETLWAIDRAAASFSDPGQRLEMVQDGLKVVKKSGAMDAVFNVSKNFGTGFNATAAKAIEKMKDIKNPADLRNALVSAGITDQKFLDSVIDEYKSQGIQGTISSKEKSLIKNYKSKPFSYYDENVDLYRNELSGYLAKKANALETSSDKSDKELSETYAKSSVLIANWKKRDKDNKKYLLERKALLAKAKEEVKEAKRLGLSKSEIEKFKKQERNLQQDVNFLERNRAMDSFDKYKAMWNSMNNIYLKGNLFGSIMDGTFFSADNKILNPAEDDYMGMMFIEHEFLKQKKTDEYGNITKDPKTGKDKVEAAAMPTLFNIPKNDAFFRLILEEDKNNNVILKGFYRKKTSFYNKAFTSLSYFTPQKFLQVNGEYWAYLMYRNRMKTFEQLLDMSKDQAAFAKKLYDMKFFQEDGRMNFFNLGWANKDSIKQLEDLLGDKNKAEWEKYFNDNKEILKILGKFRETDERLFLLLKRFSFWERTKDAIKSKITDFVIGRPRERLAGVLEKIFSKHGDILKGIDIWKAGGGVQALMRGFAQTIVKGLKLDKAIFSHLLASAISGGLSTVAFTSYKILAQIAGFLLFIGFFFLFYFFAYNNSLTQTYSPTAYAAPEEVVQCSGFEPENLIDTGDVDIIVPPPSNSSCPLGTGTFRCTQGPEGSYSHKRIKNNRPVDIANGSGFYFYAPQYCDSGGCRITGARSATLYRCLDKSVYVGDEVFFNDGQGNVFIIVHAKALVPIQQEVSGGQAVAYIYGRGELSSSGTCWSGPHLHLEITHNGGYIDPLPFLQQMGCSVPGTNQCAD